MEDPPLMPAARKEERERPDEGGRKAILSCYTSNVMATEKLYKAEYLGSGTFIISKPKRKKTKLRQSRVKSPQRGARK